MNSKSFFILVVVAVACMFATGCGHSVGMVGVGTGWRAGGGEYGVSYGEGLFGTFITKDGVNFEAELDSTHGFSYDPSTGTYKGIRSIKYQLAPQINGYSVQFAKENPEVAKAYYEALVKYYENQKDIIINPETKPAVSDEKSTSAVTQIAETIKAVIDAGKEKKEAEKQEAEKQESEKQEQPAEEKKDEAKTE